MPLVRRMAGLLLAAALAGCAAVPEIAPPPVQPGEEPEDALLGMPTDTLPADSAVASRDAMRVLEERWKAPFDVVSRGRITPRSAHDVRVVVAVDEEPAPQDEPLSVGPNETREEPIPSGVTVPPPPAEEVAADEGTEPGPGEERAHTVMPGDTLWSLSRRYGVSMEALRAANELEGDRIRIGQVLIIPGDS